MGRSVVLDVTVAGDLVLDEPNADHWLSGISPVLRQADLAIGHLEVPHTRRGQELTGDVPAPGAPPENLAAIAKAGFAMLSLAGNHISDCGAEGIEDTITELDALGLGHAGAGENLAIARRPAMAEVRSRRVALLSYNCVGPVGGWAAAHRAGAAYLPILTSDGSPIAPAAPLERVSEEALAILREDVRAACARADVVLVALHKGLVHVPARLAPYERPLAHAAIEAGADAVLGHHAHIVKGIEIYRGRPIFHGLGNGCVVTSALSPSQAHPARAEWAERRKRLFGFEPDPAYHLAPFHPEAVNAMLGKISWRGDGSVRAGVVPIDVEPPGRPVLADGPRGQEIFRYIERITREGGLPAIRIDAEGWIEAAA
jgi:poly-gamma-glutamate capsule biosynthesis protein CapA/YwtB (metallophosphatase superfamily)